jgi:hypothetical protein
VGAMHILVLAFLERHSLKKKVLWFYWTKKKTGKNIYHKTKTINCWLFLLKFHLGVLSQLNIAKNGKLEICFTIFLSSK